MAKPRDYNALVEAATVARWFEDGLMAYRGRKPDTAACYRIVDNLQKTVNRALNTQRDEADQKDVQPEDVHAKLFCGILDARRELLLAIEEFFNSFPQERDPEQDVFGFVKTAALLEEYYTPALRPQIKSRRGQPNALWHSFAPTFAKWVKTELLAVGYTETLDGSDPDNAVARIGAAMVSYVIGKEVDYATFASVLRGKKRPSRAKNPRKKPYSPTKASSVRLNG